MDAKASISESDSGLVLDYNIHERYTLLPVGDFGITKNSFWIGAGLMESNFAGKGIYAYGYYQYNSQHTIHLIFRNPYIFASPWGFELQVRNLPSKEFYADSEFLNQFSDLSVAVRYEFRFENDITTGTSFRRQKADISGFITSQQDLTIHIDRSSQVWFLQHNIQKLAYRYFYVEGWKNLAYVSVQIPYNSSYNPVITVYNELKYYFLIRQKGNLALRIMAGISSETEEPFFPFLADSYYSFRGIGYRAFRGDAIGLLNAEYRYTCFENHLGGIQLLVFSDVGYVSQESGNPEIRNDFNPGQLFSGAGMRIIYKKAYNAILTVDYGFDILYHQKGGLVVGWGQYF